MFEPSRASSSRPGRAAPARAGCSPSCAPSSPKSRSPRAGATTPAPTGSNAAPAPSHQAHTQPAAPVSKPRARAGLRFGGTARGEVQMRGLMMGMPLLVSDLIRHADRHHGTTEIVSRRVEGDLHRYTYRDAPARPAPLANALRP